MLAGVEVTPRDIHVLPLADLIEHIEAATCPCRPTPEGDEPTVYVHHSADGREHFEPDHVQSERVDG